VPVLLLVAGQPPDDRRAEAVEVFRRALPDAAVRHCSDSGHNALIDAAEEALEDVGDWLRENGSG
jgi:pimeloyl-ACP methyl ester carboxylesterase